MLTTHSQRWREQRATYRPSEEIIDPSSYEVAPIDVAVAKGFVTTHHYSHSFPADRERYGLFKHGDLCGVAVFSVPMSYRVFDCLAVPVEVAAELGRFVLLDEVPGNGETWFLARCFDLLKAKGYAGLVSFSDPVPRTTLGGDTIFRGHIGGIYKAHNAAYQGVTRRRSLRLLPDGTIFSDRNRSKIRGKETGWRYAVDILELHGAKAPTSTTTAGLRAWLPKALAATTRVLRHTGNHKYAWGLKRVVSKKLTSLPYPTFTRTP